MSKTLPNIEIETVNCDALGRSRTALNRAGALVYKPVQGHGMVGNVTGIAESYPRGGADSLSNRCGKLNRVKQEAAHGSGRGWFATSHLYSGANNRIHEEKRFNVEM